jgi:hypothetical protein
MDHDWSWKTMHRLIVTSATYRQSAQHTHAEAMEQIDPANRLRWRWDVQRLDAEQIFDALQSVSGRLDLQVGGRSVEKEPRRAIYRKVLRNKPDPILSLFDTPDGVNSMPHRPTTTTATQALALLNSSWADEFASAAAKALSSQTDGNVDEAIGLAYEVAWGRPPTEREAALAWDYLADGDGSRADRASLAELADICHVLINSNEFIYLH